ncbi:hypothetical protein [Prescottella equi]|uniref:hypothetical protein n=1 Tax=Rhodococcus hoagii TaxID=43767 RepID=UPI00111C00D2|nr:hypothetical protein [Prescottella equi]
MSRLATHVHVPDDSGVFHVFGPADQVPGWAAGLITNPAAWAERPAPEVDASGPEWPAGDPSDDWKLPELHAYAAANGIGLGDAKKKADILAVITDALSSEGAADDDSGND